MKAITTCSLNCYQFDFILLFQLDELTDVHVWTAADSEYTHSSVYFCACQIVKTEYIGVDVTFCLDRESCQTLTFGGFSSLFRHQIECTEITCFLFCRFGGR